MTDIRGIPYAGQVPIQLASEALVRACAEVAFEQTPDVFDRTGITERMVERIDSSHPIDVLVDDDGPAGWFGWVPYGTDGNTWETTTFLAPRLRGTGVFAQARCAQAHALDNLVAEHGTDFRAITSIHQDNPRSLAASRRYVSENGWPDTWRLVDEPHKDRTAWVFTWPILTPHTCLRGSP